MTSPAAPAPSALADAPTQGSPAAPGTPRSPTPQALQLGYLGLVPFVAGALLMWVVLPDARQHVARGLSAYAAVIVSFLGGIHWGLSFRRRLPTEPVHFAWGVTPPLVACVAQMMSADAALVIHGVMLVSCYLVDRKAYPLQDARAWLTLRFRATVLASLCCFIGAAGV